MALPRPNEHHGGRVRREKTILPLKARTRNTGKTKLLTVSPPAGPCACFGFRPRHFASSTHMQS